VIKEAADPEANIIFGTVIDDRMRDEIKVTVIATGFDSSKKVRAGKAQATTEAAPGIEANLDERSREILAEIERERTERASLNEQLGEPSPFARSSGAGSLEPTEVRPAEREPLPVRPGLDRPSYGETDLDIPSFLRRKSD
jgi:cell division protein FtsZ